MWFGVNEMDSDGFGLATRQGPWVRLCLRLWVGWDWLCAWRGARISSGAWGETWAARLLRAHGCAILERNVYPCRHGELDLIAKRHGVILFVEVKTRASEAFGRPLVAIGPRKRQLLRRCATHWLAQNGLLRASYRFDAVEVVGAPGRGMPTLRWIRRLDMTATRAPDCP